MDKDVSNSKPIKNREKITKILDIALVVVGAIALAFSAVLFFQKTYYEPFYVNGQSMYPTFNAEAVDQNGNLKGIGGGSSAIGDSHLDYGIMNCHKKALDKLERFDIVVGYKDSSKTIQYIKRIVGMPGETIKFVQSSGEDNGDLYVKEGDDFVLVPQPIENKYKVMGDSSKYSGNEIVLGDNEYYYIGDNRAATVCGIFEKDWIVGKVVAIVGHCTLKNDSKTGENTPNKVKYYLWPRFVK